MTLVTIHLAPGQTPKQLIGEIRQLNGGGPVRLVSGRFGALVDAELAYRYLKERYGPSEPAPASVPPAPPAEQAAVQEATPSKPKRPSRAKAKTAKTADQNEEV